VIISNTYDPKEVYETNHQMTLSEWSESMRQIVDTFRGSTKKIVLLAPPPGDGQISDCYGKRSTPPADCIRLVGSYWLSMAEVEQDLAESFGGTWIDSRPWFCSNGRRCPSFVGSTPTKFDAAHMVPAYGEKIYPAMGESFSDAGVF
jgi:hypothetical protein